MLQYQIPADVNAYKVVIRRKQGEMPATSIDGEQVYEGSNEIFYDTPAFSSQAYYYRAFTINQVGQMNDEQEGAVASVTLTAREPGSISNLQASDEKGTTTGSFDLPTVQLEGREVVNRFVAGYVVIQKEDSTPASETDGEVIESRDIDPIIAEKTVTFTKTEQKNGANLFITVFLKNHEGQYFISTGQTVELVVEALPTYTFTGQHQLIDDGNGHWRIKFLSSGVLEWLSGESEIDVFLVGGGGSGAFGAGGGSGYTKTQKNIRITKNQKIQVTIGTGGGRVYGNSYGISGGTTTFASYSALGGSPGGPGGDGGNGGSGGGAYNLKYAGYTGGGAGCNGGNGQDTNGVGDYGKGGNGQGSTTREFGEISGPLHAGGGQGACATGSACTNGSGPNGESGYNSTTDSNYYPGKGGAGYGGGGGGAANTSGTNYNGAGSNGVVIIRNSREG
ncbi:glycine-rich domain-containing protein [uncultured Negativibacillus sp.]|uniref:glycine-rich domain-containing protein n=1 Tax=uncultured Negativibacillus sp. TaxID=1980696 RepID=UPI0025D03BCD|nr:hypothetical protein [uncultured Negativibacillus sp.]